MSRAYLLGALHDGTIRPRTIRICQREKEYVLFLKSIVEGLGARAWIYREGKSRNLFVVEFCRSVLRGELLLTRADRIDYVRGYFDAEGGVPSGNNAAPYLYFAQKNRSDLCEVQQILVRLRIACGRLHNPSRLADPDYWRFYVARGSISRFANLIGSWHPRKSKILIRIAARESGRST